MRTRKCILCSIEITGGNDSREHLIQNSIGGRKRVRGVTCKTCNSATGEEWDAEFARQLQPLSAFFSITRQRGEVPPHLLTTVSGQEFIRRSDGQMTVARPSYEEAQTDGGVRISISAPTMQQARQLLNRAKARYAQIDADSIVASAESKYQYLDEPMKMSLGFGGEKAGRSLVKSCVTLAVNAGMDAAECVNALEYLRNPKGFPCFGYFYERDLICNRPNEVFHCVAISGDPQSGQLIGYAEYYGVYRVIVGLSDRYTGRPVKAVYAINPITGKEISGLDVDLALTPKDIQDTYEYKKIPHGAMAEAADKVIPIGMKNNLDREMQSAIKRAVHYAFANCGARKGEMPTREQKLKLARLVSEQLQPFIMHNLRPRSADLARLARRAEKKK
jgi:HNH endonuclease